MRNNILERRVLNEKVFLLSKEPVITIILRYSLHIAHVLSSPDFSCTKISPRIINQFNAKICLNLKHALPISLHIIVTEGEGKFAFLHPFYHHNNFNIKKKPVWVFR